MICKAEVPHEVEGPTQCMLIVSYLLQMCYVVLKWLDKGRCISKRMCGGERVRWVEEGANETERAVQSGCECEPSRGEEAVKLSVKQ